MSNSELLLKEIRDAHPSTRWLIWQRVARDFGEGFVEVLRRQVEEVEHKRSRRTPRAQRKGGASA